MTKYEKLTHDLYEAYKSARGILWTADTGGTMNFDCPGLFLPRWNEAEVKKAAEKAGFRAYKHGGRFCGKPGYFTFRCPCGAGNMQSEFAEAITEYMRIAGYDAFTYEACD